MKSNMYISVHISNIMHYIFIRAKNVWTNIVEKNEAYILFPVQIFNKSYGFQDE
jgi:hypothetical protein